MPKQGQTRRQKIDQDRRESLRELLRQQGHEQYVLVLLDKLESLDEELQSVEVQRISKAIDTRMKLIAKYLADDKAPQDINLGGQEGNPIESKWVVEPVKPLDAK